MFRRSTYTLRNRPHYNSSCITWTDPLTPALSFPFLALVQETIPSPPSPLPRYSLVGPALTWLDQANTQMSWMSSPPLWHPPSPSLGLLIHAELLFSLADFSQTLHRHQIKNTLRSTQPAASSLRQLVRWKTLGKRKWGNEKSELGHNKFGVNKGTTSQFRWVLACDDVPGQVTEWFPPIKCYHLCWYTPCSHFFLSLISTGWLLPLTTFTPLLLPWNPLYIYVPPALASLPSPSSSGELTTIIRL